jgi:hypothetical protein
MAILTAASIANETLKILNQAFDDAYNGKDREKRERIGGNEVAHGAQLRKCETQHSKADETEHNT